MSQTPWKGKFQNSAVQLMSELAQRHRVLYVDYQYTLKDALMGVAGRRDVPIRALLKLDDSLTQVRLENGSEIYVWVPPVSFPTNWLANASHDKVLRWNVNRLIKELRNVMARLNFHHPLVVNAFNPVWGSPMVGRLNEFATVYYCYDEITAESWISRHGQRYEKDYLQQVDAVITTSEALRQAKSVRQPATFCVKNGANFTLFHQARLLADQNPPARPTVGYLGTADNRIDTDLIDYCVRTMPEVDFQFIGEVNDPSLEHRLAGFSNVSFTPSVPPSELPALLARLSVGIIPFVCNEHTYTIYPLKINEYLAAGLAVVSTPFSILNEFEGVVELARDPESFARALRRALQDQSPERIRRRVEVARANSWEKRAEEFESIVGQLPNALIDTLLFDPVAY